MAAKRSTDAAEWGDPLTLPGTTQRRRLGRVESSVIKSIRKAQGGGSLSDLDGGAAGLARSLARTVDWCETNGEPHTLTLAASRLSDLLTKLRLEPTSRMAGGKTDVDWDAAFSDLDAPTQGAGHPEGRNTTKP